MTKRIIVITGGRDHIPTSSSMSELRRAVMSHGASIAHGACIEGVDRIVSEFMERYGGVEVLAFPADWDRHGKRAGPIRNAEMCSQPGVIGLAAWPGGKGTASCIREATRRGIPVWYPEK